MKLFLPHQHYYKGALSKREPLYLHYNNTLLFQNENAGNVKTLINLAFNLLNAISILYELNSMIRFFLVLQILRSFDYYYTNDDLHIALNFC